MPSDPSFSAATVPVCTCPNELPCPYNTSCNHSARSLSSSPSPSSPDSSLCSARMMPPALSAAAAVLEGDDDDERPTLELENRASGARVAAAERSCRSLVSVSSSRPPERGMYIEFSSMKRWFSLASCREFGDASARGDAGVLLE